MPNIRPTFSRNVHLDKYGHTEVTIQDQFSEIIDLYMCNEIAKTTPISSIEIDDTSIDVDDTTGATVGDCINISEDGNVFQAIVSSISGDTINFSAPSDYAFTTSAEVCFAEWDFSVANGTTTPVIYKVCPPSGAKWDITNINFTIVDTGTSTQFTASGFGNIIGGLTNGIILRKVDGITKNVWQINNNGGFSDRGCRYDIDRAGFFGANEIGLSATYCINDKGVTIRLDGDTDDELNIIVQDDLTGLDKMAVVAQGHVVE